MNAQNGAEFRDMVMAMPGREAGGVRIRIA